MLVWAVAVPPYAYAMRSTLSPAINLHQGVFQAAYGQYLDTKLAENGFDHHRSVNDEFGSRLRTMWDFGPEGVPSIASKIRRDLIREVYPQAIGAVTAFIQARYPRIDASRIKIAFTVQGSTAKGLAQEDSDIEFRLLIDDTELGDGFALEPNCKQEIIQLVLRLFNKIISERDLSIRSFSLKRNRAHKVTYLSQIINQPFKRRNISAIAEIFRINIGPIDSIRTKVLSFISSLENPVTTWGKVQKQWKQYLHVTYNKHKDRVDFNQIDSDYLELKLPDLKTLCGIYGVECDVESEVLKFADTTAVAKVYKTMVEEMFIAYAKETDLSENDTYQFFLEAQNPRRWKVHDGLGRTLGIDEVSYAIKLSKMTITELLEEYSTLQPNDYVHEQCNLTLPEVTDSYFLHLLVRGAGKVTSYEGMIANQKLLEFTIQEEGPEFVEGFKQSAICEKKKNILYREWVYRHWDNNPKLRSHLIFNLKAEEVSDNDRKLKLIKGVKEVFDEPEGDKEIQFSAWKIMGEVSIIMSHSSGYGIKGNEVTYQGKRYYAKYATNNEAEKRFIIPQAKICERINEHEIKGVIPARHFVEIEFEGGEKRKALLFDVLPEGERLDRIIEQTGKGGMAEEEALTIIMEVAQTVKSLHDIGIYHFDIKPENIYVTKGGEVILLDFDLAFMDSDEFFKRRLWQIGSKLYMSDDRFNLWQKEDLWGKQKEVTKDKIEELLVRARAEDMFSILITLSHMFIGDDLLEYYDDMYSMREFYAVASGIEYGHLMSNVSKWLKDVLHKALKLEESQFETVDDFMHVVHMNMESDESRLVEELAGLDEEVKPELEKEAVSLTHKRFEDWTRHFKAKYKFSWRVDYPSIAITEDGSVISLIYFKDKKEWHVALGNYALFFVTEDGQVIDFMHRTAFGNATIVKRVIEGVENAIANSAQTREKITRYHINRKERIERKKAQDEQILSNHGYENEQPLTLRKDEKLSGVGDERLAHLLFRGLYETVDNGRISLLSEPVILEILKRGNYLTILNAALKYMDDTITALSEREVKITSVNLLDGAIKRVMSASQRNLISGFKQAFLSGKLNWQVEKRPWWEKQPFEAFNPMGTIQVQLIEQAI